MKNGKNKHVEATKGSDRKKGAATAPRSFDPPPHEQNGPVKKPGLGQGTAKVATSTISPKDNGEIPLVGKPGLGPVSGSVAANWATIKDLSVTRTIGDDGLPYYLFATNGNVQVLPAVDVVGPHHRIVAELTKFGLVAHSPADRLQIKEKIAAAEATTSVVATKLGYERTSRPRYFTYGDGNSIKTDPVLKVYSLAPGEPGFDRLGSLDAYERGIAPTLRDQAIPMTVFFFALSEVIKPFAKAAGFNTENMMMDLVGKSTNFKSALTSRLAGSIWGKPDQLGGYAHRWNMSNQKIEEFFRDHDNHLLILDEATLAGENPKKRGDAILNVVHRLSSGESRAVTGAAISGHSLTMLSNSNEPMRTILGASEDVIEALEARLISFKLPQRETGFFDSVPEGFSSIGNAMQPVFAAMQANHGLLARKLILEVLRRVNNDYDGLVEMIRRAVRKFMQAAGQTEADMTSLPYRRIQAFALGYATAVVAFKTGTLRKNRWGRVKQSILRAWNEHANAPATEGDPRFDDFLSDPSHLFVDARREPRPEISNKDFKKLAGIVFTAKDKTLCLAVPLLAKSQLNFSTALLKQLKRDGVLRAGKNLQSKLQLRSVGAELQRDIFYVFRIAGIPTKTRFR